MPASSRTVPQVDLQLLAASGMANSTERLIFDLFGVWKSRPRANPRFLQIEKQGNQNPWRRRASDKNQSFFIIRTRGEPRFFAIGNQRNQNPAAASRV